MELQKFRSMTGPLTSKQISKQIFLVQLQLIGDLIGCERLQGLYRTRNHGGGKKEKKQSTQTQFSGRQSASSSVFLLKRLKSQIWGETRNTASHVVDLATHLAGNRQVRPTPTPPRSRPFRCKFGRTHLSVRSSNRFTTGEEEDRSQPIHSTFNLTDQDRISPSRPVHSRGPFEDYIVWIWTVTKQRSWRDSSKRNPVSSRPNEDADDKRDLCCQDTVDL